MLITLPHIIVRVIGIKSEVAVGYIGGEVSSTIPHLPPQLYVVALAELYLVGALETIVLRYKYGAGPTIAVPRLPPSHHPAVVEAGIGLVPMYYPYVLIQGLRYRQLTVRYRAIR